MCNKTIFQALKEDFTPYFNEAKSTQIFSAFFTKLKTQNHMILRVLKAFARYLQLSDFA